MTTKQHLLELVVETDTETPPDEVETLIGDYLYFALEEYECRWDFQLKAVAQRSLEEI